MWGFLADFLIIIHRCAESLKSPHIYISSTSKCLTVLIIRTCNSVELKNKYELAVFFSHSHNLILFTVTSRVVSVLIHEIIDLHIFIFYILLVLLSSSGCFSERCGCHLFERLSPSLSLYTPLPPWTAASQLSFRIAKMSLDNKTRPVAHGVASNN